MDYTQTDKQKPEILAVRTAAQTAVFEVQSLDLRFANGQERTYERLTPARRPAVMVLAIDDGDLLMVREYAAGTERYELTCVKGLIDEGESPETAALRELQEEIGYGARDLTLLRTLYTSPGHMYSPLTVFIARHFYPSQLEGDEPEPLELVRVPLCELDALIDHPNFGDARVLAALMLLQRQMQNGI
ncbi:MAG: ADP compounds hydrolase NudE [Alysiella sp.]|uniref:ADP compounds hydrolase NudE n=1 Tax=Alysiella sp. TaxID=1872483 RepID=UPI0026DBC298|nr:ADP compounds hydrolase NudE [Alysiella sp.]MDO4432956.1 ADP compounds hydrolase NudE [Alysiella sp.]